MRGSVRTVINHIIDLHPGRRVASGASHVVGRISHLSIDSSSSGWAEGGSAREDAVGLLWTPVAGGVGGADAACGATIEIPGVDIGTCGAAGIATGAAAVGAAIGVVTAVAGSEGGDEGEAELHQRELARENCGEISPNFDNPAESPGEGWEWKGNGPEGSSEGSWVNPDTGEKLYPDLDHPGPIGPHYDYTAPDGSQYRIYPDGRIEPKP